MSEWSSKPLERYSLSEANSFVDGPFGSDLKVTDYTESGIRILQLQNLGDGFFIGSNVKHTSESKAISLGRCIVRPGDLIIAKMAEPLARACIVPPYIDAAIIVADLIKLRPAEDVDPNFLCAAINFSKFRREAERLSTGTTRTRISLSTLKRIGLLAPGEVEQKKLGELIRTFGETLEQTEALIAKTQQIKAGLMHDLFTRGVTNNGQLRPPREEAPHLYKESPLGWIPKEWNIFTTDEKLLVIDPQPDHRTPPTVEDGVPYIGIGDIAATGEVDFDLARTVSHLTLDKQLRSFEIFPDAFIFGKIGTIGQPTRIPHKRFFAVSANVVILTSEITKDSHYAYWHYQSAFTAKQIADATNTTSQPALGIQKIRQFMLAWPSRPEEQNAIISRLEAISETIVAESLKNEKLLKLKAGLMHDLLTGRVRVKTESLPSTESAHV